MPASALAGVFTEYQLTYEVQSDQPTGTDEWGNPVYGKTPQSMTVRLKAYQFNQLAIAVGADEHTVRGRGACVNPNLLPSGIGVGSTFSLTWGGQAGIMTITQVDEAALADVQEVVGQKFQWSWRPGGA